MPTRTYWDCQCHTLAAPQDHAATIVTTLAMGRRRRRRAAASWLQRLQLWPSLSRSLALCERELDGFGSSSVSYGYSYFSSALLIDINLKLSA